MCYDMVPKLVPVNDRQSLWERMEPVMRRAPDAPPHADFDTAQFTDGRGHDLLIIEESC
jgi:hypothetical protein